jgi:hypothetical protein
VTDEELLIIDCAVYDPGLHDAFRGAEDEDAVKTLGEWASQWLKLHGEEAEVNPGGEFSGGMTNDQFKMVVQTVLNDTSLSGLTVADVTPRAVSPEGKPLGNQLTLTSPDGQDVIVAFQGTANDAEWYDNGLGGFSDTTDTPVQEQALHYFDDMMADYGPSPSAPGVSVTTTGHSKGGNLAMYVSLLRPDIVSRTLNVDGQGFNAATLLKYAEAVAAQSPNIATLAGAMDFVNLLFTPVGSQAYTESPEPGWLGGGFANQHSPVALLRPGGDGGLVVRPVAGQDPAMGDAAGFVDYLQKFMPGDDFALLCRTAMGLKTGAVGVGDVFDRSTLAVPLALLGPPLTIAALLTVFDTADVLSAGFRPPYAHMLDGLMTLLGNYLRGNGIDDPAAIRGLIDTLFAEGWRETAADMAADKLVDDLTHVPDLPYSAVVRDFSDQTRRDLLAMVAPGPEPWPDAAPVPPLPELDFGADEAAWDGYRREVIERQHYSYNKINQIFDDVDTAVQDYARTIRAMAERVGDAARRLSALNANLSV